MNKYTKKNKQPTHKPGKTPFQTVQLTNYLNLAIMIRTLYQVYGWRKKRISDFLESYIALMQEVADSRSTVPQFVHDTKELTGIDVKKLLNEVYAGFEKG